MKLSAFMVREHLDRLSELILLNIMWFGYKNG